MRIKFHVTQEDIDLGCKTSASECMITRCMRRTLAWHTITTTFQRSTIYFEYSRYRYKHKKKISAKIHEFDTGKTVTQFSFYLNIPKSVLEKIGYFDRKGDTFVESYIGITSKENNIEQSKQQRRTQIQEQNITEVE